jgi:hypothetical protein
MPLYDKASKGQIAKIHALAKQLGMIDGSDKSLYLDVLATYSVKSSKELSFRLAGALIADLEQRAVGFGCWTPKPPANKAKHADKDKRTDGWATAKQIRYIEGLWNDVSFSDDKAAALQAFLHNHFGVDSLVWVKSETASKIIEALKDMKTKKRRTKA